MYLSRISFVGLPRRIASQSYNQISGKEDKEKQLGGVVWHHGNKMTTGPLCIACYQSCGPCEQFHSISNTSDTSTASSTPLLTAYRITSESKIDAQRHSNPMIDTGLHSPT